MKTKHRTILSAVCEHFDMSPYNIFSMSRKRELVTPRTIYFYLCRKHTVSSYKDIGISVSEYRGMPYDHATIIHGERKVMGFMDINDPQTVRDLEAIEISIRQKTESLETIVPYFVDLLSRCSA